MMVRSPLPSLTLQTESLSEPGTLSVVRMCATTTASNCPATLWTPSTSSPSMVRRSESCSGDQSKSTYCFSQLRVTFIFKIKQNQFVFPGPVPAIWPLHVQIPHPRERQCYSIFSALQFHRRWFANPAPRADDSKIPQPFLRVFRRTRKNDLHLVFLTKCEADPHRENEKPSRQWTKSCNAKNRLRRNLQQKPKETATLQP